MMDYRSGLRRRVIHFGGFMMPFVVWVLLDYVGVPRPAIALRVAGYGLTAVVIVMELDSTRREVQTWGKMAIDMASKLAGVWVGVWGAWLWA